LPVRNDLAMTSEITLRGRVLPIGGQGEGAGGASRRRQDRNEKDVDEIPQQVLRNVTLIQVEHMDEVLRHGLVLSDPDSFFKPKDTAPFFRPRLRTRPDWCAGMKTIPLHPRSIWERVVLGRTDSLRQRYSRANFLSYDVPTPFLWP
jgi:hypothetical protein